MKLAQSLYEAGRITYMRSDSVNVSEQARAAAKAFIEKWCGPEYSPEKPNFFATKAKGGVAAQEAHEAVRPTDVELSPKFAAEKGMDAQELKLYDLIWRRFVASQMADAKTTVTTLVIEAAKPVMAHGYTFTASATRVDFEGFLKIMKLSLKKKTKDGEDDEDTDEVTYLPQVAVGEELTAVRWIADEKATKGPSHYSEASLIKALEENGVGRPSTYAATIETLKTREYAKTEKKKLVPLERGVLVCDWLVKKMDALFSVGYTAKMEAELDEVEEKGVPMDAMLSAFYGKFIRDIGVIVEEERPATEKFDAVFAILADVQQWQPAKKVGKRVYDDKAFVESVQKQMDEKKPLSARQLQFLVRMAMMYKDQIPDCEDRLAAAGLGTSKAVVERADPEVVAFCFETMERIGGMERNPFLKSLREQYDRGKGLSVKQLQILARSVGENAGALDDCATVRERLSEYVPDGFGTLSEDPVIPGLLKLMDSVTEWRPPTKKGKRVYDDRDFVKSLKDQFARRRSLSPRQLLALKRVASLYRTKIPNYDEQAVALGLRSADDGASK